MDDPLWAAWAVEEATLDDVPQLCDLLAILFGQEADFKPNRAKQIVGLRLILAAPHLGRIFLVRRGKVIAGMMNLLITVSVRNGISVVLEDLIVRGCYRAQGAATALLDHAVAFAHSIEATQITLLTDETNARAIRLYQRHGFSMTPLKPMRWKITLPG